MSFITQTHKHTNTHTHTHAHAHTHTHIHIHVSSYSIVCTLYAAWRDGWQGVKGNPWINASVPAAAPFDQVGKKERRERTVCAVLCAARCVVHVWCGVVLVGVQL